MKKNYEYSCGKGWKDLIDPLIEMCEKNNVQINQIKEKFGGLRFYVASAGKEIYDAIDEAERKSFETCESCGAPGKLRKGGWLKTLCDKCDKLR